jgi:hypothetical protein
MRNIFPAALFTAILAASAWAFAEPASQFDASQERARKDYETTMARIAAVSKADQRQCANQAGPAGKACTIQTNGKREAAEEDAKLALAHAREEQPVSRTDQEKAAAAGKRKAKAAYGVANARIRNNRNLANVQCSKLKKDEEQRCKRDVHARYTTANEDASSAYARALARAQAIVDR